MKKIFTLAAAVLASFSLTTAQTTYSLIKSDGSLNSEDFFGGVAPLTDGNVTFEDVVYNNYIKFGGTSGTPNYAVNKTVGYNCKSAATDVKIYVTNTNSSKKYLYITTFDEAASAFVNDTIAVLNNEAKVITKSYTNTTNKTIYLHVNSVDVKIYKFDATENGAALKQAGEVGYSINFNKGRFCAPASTTNATKFEGMKFLGITSNYSPNNNAELQIKSAVSDNVITTFAYVEFDVAAACQLHVKDNNGKGYWVSQTLAEGADADLVISKDTTVDLYPGKWYIISSKKGAIKFNLIEFLEPDLTPALSVNKGSVDLNVTAAVPAASAKVKFTGKNLTAGTYNLTVPNLAGLSVAPTSVTVTADGLLDEEVTIAYTSAVDVEAASSSISLAIDALSAAVTINYSAVLAKEYATSLNIEQLVLNNGMSADITAALRAANLEFANIDALDTLNDDASKTARNYAFLGLKMRKNVESKMALWLAQGSTLKIRFGNVPANVTVTINGEASTITKEDIANINVTDANVYSYTATEEAYIAFTCNTSKALVYKQIMINEEIAEVVLPDPSQGTAINNTNANVKAVKIVRNGQLFIEKNGVVYNAQGAIVK